MIFIYKHDIMDTEKRNDNIYIYVWEDLQAIYVGRTINPKTRHYSHAHCEYETTFKFCKEHGVKHPKMRIIETGLTLNEGKTREIYWIKIYREKSVYIVLNKLKGGQTGLIEKPKWTKETVFEESKKYISRSSFKYGNGTAYSVARKNKWLDEMTWLKKAKPKLKWTKEVVFEESKKYYNRGQFQVNCGVGYNVALNNGWLDEMTWLEKGIKLKWTKEAVFEESKKYHTRNSFRKGSSAYRVALNNGWLDEMTWLKPDVKWTKEKVFIEAQKYSYIVDFKNNVPYAYRVARENKWLDEMTWLKYKTNHKYMKLKT